MINKLHILTIFITLIKNFKYSFVFMFIYFYYIPTIKVKIKPHQAIFNYFNIRNIKLI